MGRHRIYPPGRAPSDYVPRPKNPRRLAIDNGLAELCDLQLGQPLSQHVIAEFCGVSQQFICKLERQAKRKLQFRLAQIGVRALPGGRGMDLRAALRGLGA